MERPSPGDLKVPPQCPVKTWKLAQVFKIGGVFDPLDERLVRRFLCKTGVFLKGTKARRPPVRVWEVVPPRRVEEEVVLPHLDQREFDLLKSRRPDQDYRRRKPCVDGKGGEDVGALFSDAIAPFDNGQDMVVQDRLTLRLGRNSVDRPLEQGEETLQGGDPALLRDFLLGGRGPDAA